MSKIADNIKVFFQSGEESITFQEYEQNANRTRKENRIPVNLDFRDRSRANKTCSMKEKEFMSIVEKYGSDIFTRKFVSEEGTFFIDRISQHPLSQKVSHINFLLFNERNPLAKVRIVLKNKELNREKVNFHIYQRVIEVPFTADKIPSRVEIDVTNMKKFDFITTDDVNSIENISLPSGKRLFALVSK